MHFFRVNAGFLVFEVVLIRSSPRGHFFLDLLLEKARPFGCERQISLSSLSRRVFERPPGCKILKRIRVPLMRRCWRSWVWRPRCLRHNFFQLHGIGNDGCQATARGDKGGQNLTWSRSQLGLHFHDRLRFRMCAICLAECKGQPWGLWTSCFFLSAVARLNEGVFYANNLTLKTLRLRSMQCAGGVPANALPPQPQSRQRA